MTQHSDRTRPTAETAHLTALMERIAGRGDRDAFRALFAHFAPRVRTFLIKRNVPPAQADDLTQDVMMAVWRRASGFDAAKASATTWIYTIARNLHIDQYRKAVRASRLDGRDPVFQPPEQPLADELCERSENVTTVGAALGDLPDDQKQVLGLAFNEGLSHREIATVLKLPLGTVKSRIRLAMDKLRQKLGDMS